ncbi:RNA-directed DNA polymerase [Pseudomonas monteilii]|uniref:RNA-directed DNA polymerase n=1 Tax=Pseudomonas monteilii TaxID=76759 RepID=UPI00383A3A42
MLEALLEKGFLPKELPPLFTSQTLRRVAFLATKPESMTKAKAGWTQPMHHNLSRVGGLRRRLTIPNPSNFFRLASVFALNSQALTAEWAKSPFSHTRPNYNPFGERAIASNAGDRAAVRAAARVGARYILKADISQFYSSIYTHTIPWALHTKPVAKSRMRDNTLFGNIIDSELQACQSGQTKGIAIGPDTSLGVSELLLSSIDSHLTSTCKIVGGVRFIDDIELSFSTLSDAEHALITLEAQLYERELQLNGNKTAIHELPAEIESIYVSKIRPIIPSKNSSSYAWIDYFNRTFELARRHPAEGVIRYSAATLKGVPVSDTQWELVQNLLWQCIALDPGCLKIVVDVLLIGRDTSGCPIDTVVASKAINSLIQVSAPVGHGSEVVWSIWTSMLLGLTITSENQKIIALMEDGCVATASMQARSMDIFDNDFSSPLWESWITDDCFLQDHWLFAYECYRRNWLPQKINASNIIVDPTAIILKELGVTFLDVDAPHTYTPTLPQIAGDILY